MDNKKKKLRKRRRLDPLIINKPEALTNLRHKAELSITTIGWIVWIFLCRPALLAFLWLIGFRIFFRHMIDLSGLAGLQELKVFYISAIVGIILIVRGWNMYNKARYGKKMRRTHAQGVSGEMLEEYFLLPKNSAVRLQEMKEINIDFLDDCQLRIQESNKSSHPFDGYFKPS